MKNAQGALPILVPQNGRVVFATTPWNARLLRGGWGHATPIGNYSWAARGCCVTNAGPTSRHHAVRDALIGARLLFSNQLLTPHGVTLKGAPKDGDDVDAVGAEDEGDAKAIAATAAAARGDADGEAGSDDEDARSMMPCEDGDWAAAGSGHFGAPGLPTPPCWESFLGRPRSSSEVAIGKRGRHKAGRPASWRIRRANAKHANRFRPSTWAGPGRAERAHRFDLAGEGFTPYLPLIRFIPRKAKTPRVGDRDVDVQAKGAPGCPSACLGRGVSRASVEVATRRYCLQSLRRVVVSVGGASKVRTAQLVDKGIHPPHVLH